MIENIFKFDGYKIKVSFDLSEFEFDDRQDWNRRKNWIDVSKVKNVTTVWSFFIFIFIKFIALKVQLNELDYLIRAFLCENKEIEEIDKNWGNIQSEMHNGKTFICFN